MIIDMRATREIEHVGRATRTIKSCMKNTIFVNLKNSVFLKNVWGKSPNLYISYKELIFSIMIKKKIIDKNILAEIFNVILFLLFFHVEK